MHTRTVTRFTRFTLAVCIPFVLGLPACNQSGKTFDTPTSGHTRISVDESFYPVIAAELMVFHNIYKDAVISAVYAPEGQALKDFMADSTKVIVMSRELNEEELKYFKEIEITPRTVKIAKDAVALIVNPENPDTALTMEELDSLFKGYVSNWNTLDPQHESAEMRIVFDNTSSSTARYIKEKFKVDSLPGYCFAADSNAQVVDYVSRYKNAIGVIAVNWISDAHDSTSIRFLQKVKVVRVIGEGTGARGKQPYQAYIGQGTYPLTREVFMISREGRYGLGYGFMAFVAGNTGQRILQKTGLMPVNVPVRLVSVSKN